MTAQEVLLVVYLVLGPSRNIFLLKIGTKWPKKGKKKHLKITNFLHFLHFFLRPMLLPPPKLLCFHLPFLPSYSLSGWCLLQRFFYHKFFSNFNILSTFFFIFAIFSSFIKLMVLRPQMHVAIIIQFIWHKIESTLPRKFLNDIFSGSSTTAVVHIL